MKTKGRKKKKTVFGLGGYSPRPAAKQLENIIKVFQKAGINFFLIDYLAAAMKELFFPLTGRNMANVVDEAISLMKAIGTEKQIDALLAYSYGAPVAINAISKTKRKIKKLILIAPVFGVGTIKLKWYEKILLKFPRLFPGFAEMESQEFWDSIFHNLKQLKDDGTEITFFVSEKHEGSYQDGRTIYMDQVIEEMKKYGKVKILPEPGHRAAVENINNIEEVKKVFEE